MKSSFVLKNGAIAETTGEQASILVYVAPDDVEKAHIAEKFRLDPYDLDSALDADEVPRFEVSSDRVILICNRAMSAMAQDQVRLDVSSRPSMYCSDFCCTPFVTT